MEEEEEVAGPPAAALDTAALVAGACGAAARVHVRGRGGCGRRRACPQAARWQIRQRAAAAHPTEAGALSFNVVVARRWERWSRGRAGCKSQEGVWRGEAGRERGK